MDRARPRLTIDRKRPGVCRALVVIISTCACMAANGAGFPEPAPGARLEVPTWLSSTLRDSGASITTIPGAGKFVSFWGELDGAYTAAAGEGNEDVVGLNWTVKTLSPEMAAWITSAFPNLRHLAVDGAQLQEGALSRIAELPRLETLSIQGWRLPPDQRLTDEDLAPLSTSPRLRYLDVRGHYISGEGFERLTTLETIIAGTLEPTLPLSGEGIRSICRLPHLKKLSVDYVAASGRDVAEIGRLKELEQLVIRKLLEPFRSGDASDALAAIASGCPKLREFSIPEQLVIIESVRHLAALKSMRSLTIHGTPLTVELFESLGTLPQLETLKCISWRAGELPAGTARTSINLAGLARTTSLHTLEFDVINLTGRELASLPAIPTLRKLGFSVVDLEESDLSSLGSFENLDTLELSDFHGRINRTNMAGDRYGVSWSEVGLKDVPQIQHLIFMNGAFSDVSFEKLGAHPQLKSIAFVNGVLDSGTLESFPSLRNIEFLRISSATQLSPTAFEQFAKMASLRQLDLCGRYLSMHSRAAISESKSLEAVRSGAGEFISDSIRSLKY